MWVAGSFREVGIELDWDSKQILVGLAVDLQLDSSMDYTCLDTFAVAARIVGDSALDVASFHVLAPAYVASLAVVGIANTPSSFAA